MSNPFDQFSSDISAALPPTTAAPLYGAPPQPSAAPPAPPMTMMMQQQSYLQPFPPAVSGNSYGGGESNPYSGAYQQPPAPPPPSSASMVSDPFGGYGAPPPPPPPSSSSAFPPDGAYGAPGVPSSVYTNHQSPEPPQQQQQPMAPSAYTADPWGAPQQQPPPSQPSLHQDSMLVPSQQQQQQSYYGLPPTNPTFGAPPSQSYGAMEQPYSGPAPEPNPYGAPPSEHNPYGAPLTEHNPYGAPPPEPNPYGAPPPEHNPYGAPTSEQNPYGSAPPPPEPNPYGAPPTPNPYGAPEQLQPPNPYGAQSDQTMLHALVPSQYPTNPYAQQVAGYGQPTAYGYGGPPPPPPVDPFSVFEAQLAKAPAPAPLGMDASGGMGALDPTASDDDFWGSFGPNVPDQVEEKEEPVVEAPVRRVEEEKKGDENLPAGGEWYDARIFTPTLGVMFFKPQELTDSLFLNTEKDLVVGLGERPVVAFIVEGSSARSAGVELGHVLLKVNGVDVKSPKDASRLIKEGPRPLPLTFYVPKTDVVVAEGEHMVKYDTKETTAPNSAKDWKPKYVVIGGIIAQPWMMNMYRSKSEYDIAVIETQARRPVSVKVKQFSLQGARIQNDWQGPQMVKYKNKMHPWKYICVLPVARNPIKISSPNLQQLKPVHEGIRRVLLAQQRTSGSNRGGGSRQADYAQDDNHQRQYHSERPHGSQFDSPSHGGGTERYGQHEQQHGYSQPQHAYGY